MLNLFKKKPKVTLDDPVFGVIEFDSDSGIDSWSHIPPDDNAHMICIDAPSEGPTDAQRTFYSSLEQTLSTRVAECRTFISTCDAKPPNLDEMTVYAIDIGSDDELARGEFEIELSDADAFQIHRVIFKDMKAIGYEVDD